MAAFQRRMPTIADTISQANGKTRRGEQVRRQSHTVCAIVLAPSQFFGLPPRFFARAIATVAAT